MKKLILCFYFTILSIFISFGQHYLNGDYSNPYFEIYENDDKSLRLFMALESSESFVCDDLEFICTKENDGNYYFYLGEKKDNENVIIVYASQLNDEGKPSKIVVKSTNEDFHPCELIAATYVFEPVGD